MLYSQVEVDTIGQSSPIDTMINIPALSTTEQTISEGQKQAALMAGGERPDGFDTGGLGVRDEGEFSDAGESVEYGSEDSSFTDLILQQVHLYGDAYVRYKEFDIKADYIVLNLFTNEVEASARPNVNKKAEFKSGDQHVSAEKIRYNMDTEQGIVHGARIQQNNLYIHGAVSKFKKAGSDALHIDDVIYNKNALITTCNKDHPHWGIRTTKFKMIPDKLAVIGPMDMELAGIPTPLAFPFAFAPLFTFGEAASGLIFPQDPIQNTRDLGLGMRGLGYHFAISDRLSETVTGDIYTRGSWSIKSLTNYKKRYKYTGSVDLSFSHQIVESANSVDPSIQNAYSINISHRQDSKAHPFRTVGGTLRFSVNDFDRRNYSDARSQLNSQINSNFNYSYRLTPKLNFSAGISHSQNTQTRNINFNLPNIQLRLSKIFPFKKKSSSSAKEKWFEKINVTYNGQLKNSVSTQDSILFTKETLESFRSGLSHEIDMGASYKMLQHFSFNTNISYDDFWYFQTYEPKIDSITKKVVGDVNGGFRSLRDISVRAGLSTNVFGTIQFAKGWLRGLRHRMTPSVSLSFMPNTEGYYEFFDEDPDDPFNELEMYNPFRGENGERLFASRGLQKGGMSINFGIDNVFEGKYWSKKDSSEKKFKIFDRVSLNGGYDLARDSLKFRDISLSASARFFNGKTSLSINGSLTPYVTDGTRKINKSLISQGEGLLDLRTFSASLTTTITLKEIRDLFQGNAIEDDLNSTTRGDRSTTEEIERRSNRNTKSKVRKSGELPEFFSWFEDFSFSHNYRIGIREVGGVRGLQTIAHTIQIRTGNIPISEKWSMRVDNIAYNFTQKRLVYPSLSISRQLHCWEMRAGWQPQLDTYTFFIGVSAAPFSQYLKYQTGRDQFSRFR